MKVGSGPRIVKLGKNKLEVGCVPARWILLISKAYCEKLTKYSEIKVSKFSKREEPKGNAGIQFLPSS